MEVDRIAVDPDICGGRPVIRGTRTVVRNTLGMVAGGCTVDRIVDAYPELSGDDADAALDYSARRVDEMQVCGAA